MPLLPELRQCSKSLRTVIHIGDGATPDGLSSYEALIAATAPKPDAKRNGPDLAGVFYADGTTGFPKGVMLRHQALALNALFTARERPANQGRRGKCAHH